MQLIENIELNGDFGVISGNFDEDVWEPCGSVENKGLSTCCENPVQIGCPSWTVTQLLQAHRKEVVAIKDQLRYVKEILTKNAPPLR